MRGVQASELSSVPQTTEWPQPQWRARLPGAATGDGRCTGTTSHCVRSQETRDLKVLLASTKARPAQPAPTKVSRTALGVQLRGVGGQDQELAKLLTKQRTDTRRIEQLEKLNEQLHCELNQVLLLFGRLLYARVQHFTTA